MADDLNVCTYSPQIAPGNNRISDKPPVNQPAITRRKTIILTYPYLNPTLTLTLKTPEFNNKVVPRISRISRTSRGGEQIVYRDPTWTRMYVVNWAFQGLTQQEAQGCLDFSSIACGALIGVLDFESRVMQGIMLNPMNPVSQERRDSKSRVCFSRAFTWKFDFQGVYM